MKKFIHKCDYSEIIESSSAEEAIVELVEFFGGSSLCGRLVSGPKGSRKVECDFDHPEWRRFLSIRGNKEYTLEWTQDGYMPNCNA